MKKQIRLTESAIQNVINEVLSDYRNSRLKEEIDEPNTIVYDIDAHIDNSSQEQIDADNEWSRKNAFLPHRNLGYRGSDLKDEDLPQVQNVFDRLDFEHNPQDYDYWYWAYGDVNRNVRDEHGINAMWAQSENPDTARLGKNRMPTPRGERNALFGDNKNNDESILDRIVSENIDKFLKKNNKNKC